MGQDADDGPNGDLVTPRAALTQESERSSNDRNLCSTSWGALELRRLPYGPIFRLEEGLLGPLLALDEVESLVRQGVELVRLLTGDTKEPCINCAASVKLIVVLPLSKETQIWSSSSRHSPSWAVTSTSPFLLR